MSINQQRSITENPFIRYTHATVQKKLAVAIEDIKDPTTEVQVIADTAMDIAYLNDAIGVFQAGHEAGLEMTASTTGVQVVEKLMGKTWRELIAPSIGERASEVAVRGLDKLLGFINKSATVIAKKTER